jgi:hypothetical protein
MYWGYWPCWALASLLNVTHYKNSGLQVDLQTICDTAAMNDQ